MHRSAASAARLLVFRGLVIRLATSGAALAIVVLVSPADYGLFAVVRAIGALGEQLVEFGLVWRLLRKTEEPTRDDYSGLATAQLAIALSALLLAAIWTPAGTAFGALDGSWRPWFLCLLGSLGLVCLGGGARVRLERQLRFGGVAAVEIGSTILHIVVALSFLAFHQFATGAFVAQIAVTVFGNLALFALAPGPLPTWRIPRAFKAVRSSGGYSVAYMVYVLREQAPIPLIAATAGLSAAGAWAFAGRLAYLIQFTYEGFSRTGLPAAAKLAGDSSGLKRLSAELSLGAASLALPAAAGLAFLLPVAESFWPKWSSGVALAQIYLPLAAFVGSFEAGYGPVALTARGWRAVLVQHAAPLLALAVSLAAVRSPDEHSLWIAAGAYHLGVVASLTFITRRELRPSWSPEVTRLTLRLGAAVVVYVAMLKLGAPTLLASLAGCALAALALNPLRLIALARGVVHEGSGGP